VRSKDLEGGDLSFLKVLSRHFLERMMETTDNLAEIRTSDLPHTTAKRLSAIAGIAFIKLKT
jgi:hypothetical protein